MPTAIQKLRQLKSDSATPRHADLDGQRLAAFSSSHSNSDIKRTAASEMPALSLQGVSKAFGNLNIVNSLSLEVEQGTVLSLLGPSGCGKTTVLRMIAGFLRPDTGCIRISGEDVTPVPPHRRNLGMVFQNYSLFPHMSVADNVAFGLKMQGTPRDKTASMIAEALTMVRMSGMEKRFPSELSGGQQQRVALARAFVTRPRLLLLDEPFGALDRKLRDEMQIEVKQLQRDLGLTFVFVTHDQEEALTLSDRIAVMRAGEIEQLGTPTEIFEAPATRFVAEFFGALNTMPVTIISIDNANAIVDSPIGRIPIKASGSPGESAIFAIRASDVRVTAASDTDRAAMLFGTLEDVIYKGVGVLCRIRLGTDIVFQAHCDPAAAAALKRGDTVHLRWEPSRALLFRAPKDHQMTENQR